MFIAFVVVTVVASVANLVAAVVDFRRNSWVVGNMTDYGIPHAWLPWLGAAKLAGGLGLLAGFVVPPLGVAAAIGLVLYFVGAVIAVLRARRWAHLVFPGGFLVLGVAALAVRLLS